MFIDESGLIIDVSDRFVDDSDLIIDDSDGSSGVVDEFVGLMVIPI